MSVERDLCRRLPRVPLRDNPPRPLIYWDQNRWQTDSSPRWLVRLLLVLLENKIHISIIHANGKLNEPNGFSICRILCIVCIGLSLIGRVLSAIQHGPEHNMQDLEHHLLGPEHSIITCYLSTPFISCKQFSKGSSRVISTNFSTPIPFDMTSSTRC